MWRLVLAACAGLAHTYEYNSSGDNTTTTMNDPWSPIVGDTEGAPVVTEGGTELLSGRRAAQNLVDNIRKQLIQDNYDYLNRDEPAEYNVMTSPTSSTASSQTTMRTTASNPTRQTEHSPRPVRTTSTGRQMQVARVTLPYKTRLLSSFDGSQQLRSFDEIYPSPSPATKGNVYGDHQIVVSKKDLLYYMDDGRLRRNNDLSNDTPERRKNIDIKYEHNTQNPSSVGTQPRSMSEQRSYNRHNSIQSGKHYGKKLFDKNYEDTGNIQKIKHNDQKVINKHIRKRNYEQLNREHQRNIPRKSQNNLRRIGEKRDQHVRHTNKKYEKWNKIHGTKSNGFNKRAKMYITKKEIRNNAQRKRSYSKRPNRNQSDKNFRRKEYPTGIDNNREITLHGSDQPIQQHDKQNTSENYNEDNIPRKTTRIQNISQYNKLESITASQRDHKNIQRNKSHHGLDINLPKNRSGDDEQLLEELNDDIADNQTNPYDSETNEKPDSLSNGQEKYDEQLNDEKDESELNNNESQQDEIHNKQNNSPGNNTSEKKVHKSTVRYSESPDEEEYDGRRMLGSHDSKLQDVTREQDIHTTKQIHSDNVENQTTPIAKYKLIKVHAPGGSRRSGKGTRHFLQERGANGVALIALDEGPFPQFRLPRARRQYMHEHNDKRPPLQEQLPKSRIQKRQHPNHHTHLHSTTQ